MVSLPMQDSAAIKTAADMVEHAYGRSRVLVNSAGITSAVPHANLEELDDKTFDRIFVTNVRGPFATIRAFAPLLRRGEDSIIVNYRRYQHRPGSAVRSPIALQRLLWTQWGCRLRACWRRRCASLASRLPRLQQISSPVAVVKVSSAKPQRRR